ncbi:MAG: ABC transporter permease [Candidatus Omnitrophica bacterium]|nr:ABC transporter permease [Candidatus Omnitrophota bacterium]MDD5430228.1 ABC transporter permease [Candidatus Omnitrophota bacterium]
MKTELHLAQRYLFRGKARHISFIGIVSCLGIGLGVATLIIVISVMNGFDRDLTSTLMKFNPHITVESGTDFKLSEVEDKVQGYAGVESASIFLQTQVFGVFENSIVPLVVKGIDFDNKKEQGSFSLYVKEDKGAGGFFIGEGLKRRFLIRDELEFYPLEKKLKSRTGKVRGVFKVGLYDIDNNYLVMDLSAARELSPNYLIFLGARIKDPFQAPEIKKRILNDFGPQVYVSTWMESNQALFSALKLEKLTMFVILSLIILVAAFNIFATLTVKVVEKTKDIGILKSLGFSQRRILAIFSLQGALLGFIGTVFGAALGLGLCFVLKESRFIRLPQEIYYIEYLPVAMNYKDIVLIVLVGFILAYISSLFPAVRAARLSPSEALRYE